MRDLIKPILGSATGWLITVITWMQQHGLGIICAIISAGASIMAWRAAKATLALRRVEKEKAQYETCKTCNSTSQDECAFSEQTRPNHCIRGNWSKR